MSTLSPSQNPPVTAAGLATVISLLLAEFTAFTTGQVTALSAAVFLVAAFLAQRFTKPKG